MSNTRALPTVGSIAPDFHVTTGRGAELTLASLRGGAVALVFLRHLGCPICRMELATLQRRHAELTAEGARVVVFVDSPDPSVTEHATKKDVPFELVADPAQVVYRSYGVERGGPLAMLAPGAVAKSLKATAQGFMHGKFEGSELQLPADFVVGPDGRITFARMGKHVGDNAPFETLLAHVLRSRPHGPRA